MVFNFFSEFNKLLLFRDEFGIIFILSILIFDLILSLFELFFLCDFTLIFEFVLLFIISDLLICLNLFFGAILFLFSLDLLE